MFSFAPLGLFWKPSYLASQSETNQKACGHARISETSEAKKILSLVQKQDHLDNQVSKYPSSTHYRLRNNPSVAKDLFRPPGKSWYYETHTDITGCSCPKDRYSWLWNDSKQILSLSWRGTCLLYHIVQSRPRELKGTEEKRVSGGKQGMRGLMVKIPTLARSRERSLARRSGNAASWTKKGWTMSQKSPPTAPGTGVLTGIMLPPRGYLVIVAEYATGKNNGPQTSAASNLQKDNHRSIMALHEAALHFIQSVVCVRRLHVKKKNGVVKPSSKW